MCTHLANLYMLLTWGPHTVCGEDSIYILYLYYQICVVGKVSQRITVTIEIGVMYSIHIDYRATAIGEKPSQYQAQTVDFNPDEYQTFNYHRNVQKSHVPTPARVPTIIIWEYSLTVLINSELRHFLDTCNLLIHVIIRIKYNY